MPVNLPWSCMDRAAGPRGKRSSPSPLQDKPTNLSPLAAVAALIRLRGQTVQWNSSEQRLVLVRDGLWVWDQHQLNSSSSHGRRTESIGIGRPTAATARNVPWTVLSPGWWVTRAVVSSGSAVVRHQGRNGHLLSPSM